MLAAGMIATPAAAGSGVASAPGGISQSQDQTSPFRTIVTADAHAFGTDDTASFYRLLMYSNEFADGLDGLIYSSSFLRFTAPNRAWDTNLFQRIIQDEYALVYENLRLHDPRYPSPQELLDLVKVGNITTASGMSEDTEGSLLIKEALLDDDDRPIYFQMWGGTNTVGAALRSIEEEFSASPDWDRIKVEVSEKANLYIILDQDTVFKNYIESNWPDLDVVMNRDQFFSVAYPGARAVRLPAELEAYFGPEVMAQIKQGALLENLPVATNGLCFCEGDSPSFFQLIPTGLRSLEDPSWGGWGGRFEPTDAHRWSDSPAYMALPEWRRPMGISNPAPDPSLVRDDSPYEDRYDVWYPQTRWIPAIQNDYAARAQWQFASYEDANHAPEVATPGGRLDISAKPGQHVQLVGLASDPDGDELSASWWQYREAGTYPGTVDISKADAIRGASFRVPADAQPGETIHVILEVTDNGEIPLTRYQRVVVTVG
jgi:hypothetical protein